MVDGIIQAVDKHLGVKKGSTRNLCIGSGYFAVDGNLPLESILP